MAKDYFVKELKPMVGKRVTEVRAMTPAEVRDFYWDHCDPAQAVVVVFEDGTAWIPMQDPEGNGPGAIAVAETRRVAV